MLDYGDIIYTCVLTQVLCILGSVFDASQHLITNCKPQTHHYGPYSRVGCPALATCRLAHLFRLVYKGLLVFSLHTWLCIFSRTPMDLTLSALKDFFTLSLIQFDSILKDAAMQSLTCQHPSSSDINYYILFCISIGYYSASKTITSWQCCTVCQIEAPQYQIAIIIHQ